MSDYETREHDANVDRLSGPVPDAWEPPSEAPFFRDTRTGEPCPRRGNVMCALPHNPDHRHEWILYERVRQCFACPAASPGDPS